MATFSDQQPPENNKIYYYPCMSTEQAEGPVSAKKFIEQLTAGWGEFIFCEAIPDDSPVKVYLLRDYKDLDEADDALINRELERVYRYALDLIPGLKRSDLLIASRHRYYTEGGKKKFKISHHVFVPSVVMLKRDILKLLRASGQRDPDKESEFFWDHKVYNDSQNGSGRSQKLCMIGCGKEDTANKRSMLPDTVLEPLNRKHVPPPPPSPNSKRAPGNPKKETPYLKELEGYLVQLVNGTERWLLPPPVEEKRSGGGQRGREAAGAAEGPETGLEAAGGAQDSWVETGRRLLAGMGDETSRFDKRCGNSLYFRTCGQHVCPNGSTHESNNFYLNFADDGCVYYNCLGGECCGSGMPWEKRCIGVWDADRKSVV